MSDQENLPDLIATAQATVRTIEARIATLPEGSDAVVLATVELETVAVDIFTLFEARMQHHFRRGPFSRKLRAKLQEAGEADLAERVHTHYLAVNVLKHGPGASLRELLATPDVPFVIRPVAGATDDGAKPVGLIDVTQAGFFEGLASTILAAHEFLEKR